MELIERDDLERFISELSGFGELHDVRVSLLPPKAFLLPPFETTFKADHSSGRVTVPPPPKPFVLFGLTLADLEALDLLDEIMAAPERDYYYFRRRESALIVGLLTEPSEFPPAGDIILRDSGKSGYAVSTPTRLGKKAFSKLDVALFKRQKKALKVKRSGSKDMRKLKKLLLDAELVKDAVSWSLACMPKTWKRLEKECLGCGVCTYVCPLCHCFSVEDGIDLSGSGSKRCRRWDACTLPGFSKIAGGESFHQSLKERYYNWYFHKFVRGYLEFGSPQCVACARCRDECPARIDIEDVLLEIVSSYKASQKKGRGLK